MIRTPTVILMEKLVEGKIKSAKSEDLHQKVSEEKWEDFRCDRSGIHPYSETLEESLSNLLMGDFCWTSWEYGKGTTNHFRLNRIKKTLEKWRKK